MTKSSGRHIQSFLLTAFVKPRSTRFPKKPESPPEQSTQDTKIKTHCLLLCCRIFFEAMKVMFAPVAKEYEKAMFSAKTEDILSAINSEEKIYFELLASHYDDCTLFFSRSDGSSVETMLNDLMEQKTQQTVDFFFRVYGKKPNADAIRLIMGAQFWHFRQLLDKRPDEDRMFACLRSILDFTNAGWRQLCLTLK